MNPVSKFFQAPKMTKLTHDGYVVTSERGEAWMPEEGPKGRGAEFHESAKSHGQNTTNRVD